jgi:hypothetical protein
MNKIKFSAYVVLWRDKINGNTYHSARITRCKDGKKLFCPLTYGYGEAYKQTALAAMDKAGWLPKKYCVKHNTGGTNNIMYERENNYPILWNVCEETKKGALKNGEKGAI